MDEIVVPIVDNMKDRQYPTPEEYTYWKSRENRTFLSTMKLMNVMTFWN